MASRISDALDVGTCIWLVDPDGELERVASTSLPPTAEAELLREVRTPPTRSRTWVQGGTEPWSACHSVATSASSG